MENSDEINKSLLLTDGEALKMNKDGITFSSDEARNSSISNIFRSNSPLFKTNKLPLYLSTPLVYLAHKK